MHEANGETTFSFISESVLLSFVHLSQACSWWKSVTQRKTVSSAASSGSEYSHTWNTMASTQCSRLVRLEELLVFALLFLTV